jgi:type VI secretion system protein ImpG
MPDRLLSLYNDELTHLRRSAAEFAAAYPAQAGRLRLSADAVEDPHVGRLMEGFAYLTARIRQKLDDEFPELTEALLGVLYPHYLAPVPACTTLQFTPVPELAESAQVPAGTELDSEPVDNESCRFRTCYPVTLWPVAIERAALAGRPAPAPANPRARGTAAVLQLSLRCLAPDAAVTALGMDRLRLCLRGGPQQVFPLYDLLAGHVLSVALARSATDPDPVILGPEHVRPVGFERDETLLPADRRSAAGYRLLSEYFAFPEKFLYVELTGLQAAPPGDGGSLQIFVYFDRAAPELERALSAENFALGCTPAINLFAQHAEPIALDHRSLEVRVVPDARRPRGLEIYSVDHVAATAPDGTRLPFRPFYGGAGSGSAVRYWHAARRPAGPANPGTEVYLALVDQAFDPAVPAGHILSVDLTCLNRDLPARLPFGGGHPVMTPVQPAASVAAVTCLTPPTRTLRPSLLGQDRWRLVSHLSLNHLSLMETADGPDRLRQMLRLYDLRATPETAAVIDGVAGLSAVPGTARAPQPGVMALCRGVDIALELDERRFADASALLFAGVLERFFALHASINAFTRLTVRGKDHKGVLKRWPARAGERILL